MEKIAAMHKSMVPRPNARCFTAIDQSMLGSFEFHTEERIDCIALTIYLKFTLDAGASRRRSCVGGKERGSGSR